jgi:hypothetical protein
VHEFSEPLGQGLLGIRVVVHWGPVGGGIEVEGVDGVLRSAHRALCCSRVRGAYPDIPGSCLVALVGYGKVWESSPIGNKSRGSGWLGVDWIWSSRGTESGDLPSKALDEAGVRSGSGLAELFSVVLDLLDMGPGASSERPCGDFSQSAKDLRGVARSLIVEVLDDGEGRGRRESVGDLDVLGFVGSVFGGVDQVRFVLVDLDGYLVLWARGNRERSDGSCGRCWGFTGRVC